MDWATLIPELFQIVLIPLLAILTKYLVSYIGVKSEEIKANQTSAIAQKYIQMAADTVSACVVATNQTYVDSLKAQGKFDGEAQKAAFNKTLESVLKILSDEAKEYLTSAFGDLNTYLTNQIEMNVNTEKPAQAYILEKQAK